MNERMSAVDSSKGFEINKNLFFILLRDLSDNQGKQSQNNTVFPTQKEVDRVGFEPTTSANFLEIQIFYLNGH